MSSLANGFNQVPKDGYKKYFLQFDQEKKTT